ncbi:MAG TPA: NAD-dependent epimerase/dehydratase family protein [Dehalococcoidia bacterium]|nr:NAD-dependent epimerase/dehydratase family protein [Dehalococcoidia bacterium]
MRIGVTGGSGFIGSHVVDALIEAGHNVRVIDLALPQRPDVEHHQADLLDQEALIDATSGLDVVFHLAAVADVNDVNRDPVRAIDLNVRGTLCLLEAARENSLRRVLFASTVWVYSSLGSAAPEVVDETVQIDIAANRHLYTSSKIAGELLCHDYWNQHQLPFTILRYGIPYGPRMRPSLVIPLFVGKALAGEPLTVAGDGSQHRKFVYVEDLARGHVLALQDCAANQTYNLDGSEKVTILRIAQAILRLVPSESIIKFMPSRGGDYAGSDVSSEKAHLELGWEPRVPFETGVAKTVHWLLEKESRLASPRA